MVTSTSKIFLDMDGVVANFVQAVLDLHELSYDEITSKMQGSYDIARILNMSTSQFWRHIEQDASFWHDLPQTDEAHELITRIESRVPKEDIYFLSSPSLSPASFYGKATWIQANFPEYINRLILTGHKHLLADQNHILIDDSDSKVHKFKQSRGKAVLFPRPWNSRYSLAKDPLNYVFRELRV